MPGDRGNPKENKGAAIKEDSVQPPLAKEDDETVIDSSEV